MKAKIKDLEIDCTPQEMADFLLASKANRVLSVESESRKSEGDVSRVEQEDWKQGVRLVDMGLPSGVKWADKNVGAMSPEDVGLYFSWGNTRGVEFGKVCKFSEEAYDESEGAKFEGNLDTEHDAATVNMGESWRMPTSDEFQELYDNCDWEYVEQNGYYGVRFTSKINGNKLFFACSGGGNGRSWNNRGSYGYYWSSSFYSSRYARDLNFDSGGVYPQNINNRYYGFAVRAVQN